VRKPPNIALLGADDPLGEAVLRLISERDIEVGEVFPLTLSDSDGCATVRGEELPLLDVAEFDWSRADIVVNVTRALAAGRLEGAAAQAGCRVIGLGGGDAAGRIAVDGALAMALYRVLAPIQQDAPLASVSAVAMLPVAAAGEAGIAELAAQTRALFAMETLEPEAFPLQIAFNLIPQVGPMAKDGSSVLEQEVAVGLKRLLANPGLAVSLTALWAPLFYGAGLAVHATSQGALDIEAIRARLSAREGIVLMDSVLPGGVATPATDAQDSDAVFVSRLRCNADAGAGLDLWLVIDTTRLEATLLADSLENLIEK
jgi:aspartate-semialdehyde dehydrogenase